MRIQQSDKDNGIRSVVQVRAATRRWTQRE